MPAPRITLKPLSVLPTTEEKKITDSIINDLAKNMGVQPRSIPKALSDTVASTVKEALSENAKDLTRNFALRKAREALSKSTNTMAMLDDRVKGALKGISHVGQNTDVKKIMQENAKLLKMKFDNLVAVGFSPDQAFQIVLAELSKPRR
jgi:hypothetical protein